MYITVDQVGCKDKENKIQNISKMLGMASKISKNYTYKCVDRSRHNGIKGAKAKCATKIFAKQEKMLLPKVV